MPEKGFSVATYAAGASLATIALVYVFAPTYFLDNSPPSSSSNPLASLTTSRKTGVVGLANAANDCFINSVLQALAGLGDLRIYLIRETHRRTIDGGSVYLEAVPQEAVVDGSKSGGNDDNSNSNGTDNGNGTAAPAPAPAPTTPRRVVPVWKIEGLQAGLVTKGLKEMIDMLNERPIYKKVISAAPFVRVLETAFRQRISRQQQDAQEFLQIVAERLCDEYHAGRRARQYAAGALPSVVAAEGSSSSSGGSNDVAAAADEEKGFPMEGQIESQIECLTCHFRPRPSMQAFCTLTLNVPQAASTSLSACFDMMLQTEYIDEFKCEKCRLVHAHAMLQAEVARKTPATATEQFRREAAVALAELQRAIDTDPEHPPASIVLPDVKYAPKRRIARHFRLVSFPQVLAIHLSRSIFDASSMSHKNSAKVAFPERLPLGGLLHRREYTLRSVVMHKGSHHSGHYESFRRQTVAAPFSNPNTFQPSQVYSPASTPLATTPRIGTSDGVASSPGAGASSGSGSGSGSSTTELPAAATSATSPEPSSPLGPQATAGQRTSQSPSLRGRSHSGAATEQPAATPNDTAETSSLRSVARSTLSRIASSSRSLSTGSREAAPPAAAAAATAAATVTATITTTITSTATTEKTKPPRQRKKKVQDRWWRISDEKVREASTREVLGMQREVYLLFYELERGSR